MCIALFNKRYKNVGIFNMYAHRKLWNLKEQNIKQHYETLISYMKFKTKYNAIFV